MIAIERSVPTPTLIADKNYVGTHLGMAARATCFPDKATEQRTLSSNPVELSLRTAMTSRKRRTVLWLFQEDYDFLANVADGDSDSKNVSMHRLVKALRKAGIRSFIHLEQHLKKSQHETSKSGA